mgnify:CR=1 FL=1
MLKHICTVVYRPIGYGNSSATTLAWSAITRRPLSVSVPESRSVRDYRSPAGIHGCHACTNAHDRFRVRSADLARGRRRARETEIADLRCALLSEQHVRWLEVGVHEAVRVDEGERAGDLGRDA